MTIDDRIRSILHGQTGPQTWHGVRILWRCTSCALPWLQDPRLPHGCRVRLSDQDAGHVARELNAHLDDLPRATCRLCAYATGGELSIDQYGRVAASGFGLSWEGVDPPGAHLLGAVFSAAWAERQSEMPPPGIVTDPERLHAVLGWLTAFPVVPQNAVMGAAQSALLALSTPPGHGTAGTEGWLWRGVVCLLPCPPLGGVAVVSLAEAMPPDEPRSRDLFTWQWRALALRALRSRLEQGGATSQR